MVTEFTYNTSLRDKTIQDIPFFCKFLKRQGLLTTSMGGLRLQMPDAVLRQAVAAILVMGYQLMQLRDNNAYRAKAENSLDNNFESLPKFVAGG